MEPKQRKNSEYTLEGSNMIFHSLCPHYTLKKLMGHIAFGACVRGWVTLLVPTVTFNLLKLES